MDNPYESQTENQKEPNRPNFNFSPIAEPPIQSHKDTEFGKEASKLRSASAGFSVFDANENGLVSSDELTLKDGELDFNADERAYLIKNFDTLNKGVKSGISVAGLRAIDFNQIEDPQLAKAINRLSTADADSNHDGSISEEELELHALHFKIEDNFAPRTRDFKNALERFDDLASMSQEADKSGLSKSEVREARTQFLAEQLRKELAGANPTFSNDLQKALTEEMAENRMGRLSEIFKNEYSIENESVHKIANGMNDYKGKLTFVRNGTGKTTSFNYLYATF